MVLARHIVAVELVEHGEVDAVSTKQRLDHGQVGPVPVGGLLHPVTQPGLHVRQEGVGVLRGPLTDQPGDHQLVVGVECRPRPHVPVVVGMLLGDVLLLGADERPDLVALDPLGGEVGEHAVLIG